MNNEDKIMAMLESMNSRLDALSADMARHNHEVEPLMKLIHEQLDDMADSPRKLKMLESTAIEHETRIWALESVVKAQ